MSYRKDLIIAVVERDDAILMRKKVAGSPPYTETWYLFGCEVIDGQDNLTTIKDYLRSEIGIDVEPLNEPFQPDTETKMDHDGIEKLFVYTDVRCRYLSGDPKIPDGAEKVAWIPKDKLSEYDIVPPSVKLLKGLGYIK